MNAPLRQLERALPGPLSVRAESGELKERPDGSGCLAFMFRDIEEHAAVSGMAKLRIPKVDRE